MPDYKPHELQETLADLFPELLRPAFTSACQKALEVYRTAHPETSIQDGEELVQICIDEVSAPFPVFELGIPAPAGVQPIMGLNIHMIPLALYKAAHGPTITPEEASRRLTTWHASQVARAGGPNALGSLCMQMLLTALESAKSVITMVAPLQELPGLTFAIHFNTDEVYNLTIFEGPYRLVVERDAALALRTLH